MRQHERMYKRCGLLIGQEPKSVTTRKPRKIHKPRPLVQWEGFRLHRFHQLRDTTELWLDAVLIGQVL